MFNCKIIEILFTFIFTSRTIEKVFNITPLIALDVSDRIKKRAEMVPHFSSIMI
jgi:hypothetical protein